MIEDFFVSCMSALPHAFMSFFFVKTCMCNINISSFSSFSMKHKLVTVENLSGILTKTVSYKIYMLLTLMLQR